MFLLFPCECEILLYLKDESTSSFYCQATREHTFQLLSFDSKNISHHHSDYLFMISWISLAIDSPFDLDIKCNTNESSYSEDVILIVEYLDRRIAMIRQIMTGILIRYIIEMPSMEILILPKENKIDCATNKKIENTKGGIMLFPYISTDLTFLRSIYISEINGIFEITRLSFEILILECILRPLRQTAPK